MTTSPLLETRDLAAAHDGNVVVRDINVTIHPGEVVALLGPNGAGKSTTLLTIAGDHPVAQGAVLYDGVEASAPLHKRARQGLALVPEERTVFSRLTVRDNLRLAGGDVDYALELFPELRSLLSRRCGLCSGGEQRMLTLARALARRPRVVLADELSLGLAPLIVGRLLEAVRAAADTGVGVMIVEQHVRRVLAIADRAYVMQRGRIVQEGPAGVIREDLHRVEASYLSDAGTGGGSAVPHVIDEPKPTR